MTIREHLSNSNIGASISRSINEDSKSDDNNKECEDEIVLKISDALSVVKSILRFSDFHTDFSVYLKIHYEYS